MPSNLYSASIKWKKKKSSNNCKEYRMCWIQGLYAHQKLIHIYWSLRWGRFTAVNLVPQTQTALFTLMLWNAIVWHLGRLDLSFPSTFFKSCILYVRSSYWYAILRVKYRAFFCFVLFWFPSFQEQPNCCFCGRMKFRWTRLVLNSHKSPFSQTDLLRMWFLFKNLPHDHAVCVSSWFGSERVQFS